MSEVDTTDGRRRVLSGMRPTGKLHLGNYMGALYNWVKLQHEYECYFFIADWHALTTDYADPSRLPSNIIEIALDFLAAGLDPDLCTIFVQSHVPQHAELSLLFGMFTPLGSLERVPTYKDQQEQLREKNLATYGFLGYPLLQSADILLYKPDLVPVGQDQVAHVELTREVANRFNHLYSPKRVVPGVQSHTAMLNLQTETDPERLILPAPEALLTPSPKLPGLDGRKMSKSYGNSILLSEAPDTVKKKMLSMTNNGQRNPQSLPGDPDICPVGDMHALFSTVQVNKSIREECREAKILCVDCKLMASNSINDHLSPIRNRRAQLEEDPHHVLKILDQGAERARVRAEMTMTQVRSATGLGDLRSVLASKLQTQTAFAYGRAHDLTRHQAIWNIEANAERALKLRDLWLKEIVPNGVVLTRDSDRVYISSKGKRIFVTTSREGINREHSWGFEAKLKTYEYLALLCWGNDRQLYDFIIPQSLYGETWNELRRADKKAEIVFWVSRVGDRFELAFSLGPPIDITACRGTYAQLA